MKKILFTGGGSAGHVIPNIALIEELLSSGEAAVCYMGTDGIEKGLIAEWNIPYFTIDCPKLIRGKSWNAIKRNLHIPAEFHRAKKQALEGLQQCKPDVVFSKGGYVALPVIAAAKKLHIPCFSHESDYSPGLANRLIARKCKYVFTSFPKRQNACPTESIAARRCAVRFLTPRARKQDENCPYPSTRKYCWFSAAAAAVRRSTTR